MEENIKKKHGLIITIIILIILLICVIGYITVKMFYNNPNNNSSSNTTTTIINKGNDQTENNSTIKKDEISLSNFPNYNDESVIIYGDIYELSKKYLSAKDYETFESSDNFDNIKFSINEYNFKLSCIDYDYYSNDINIKGCKEKNININDKLNISFNDYADYTGVLLLITNDYYIIQYGNDLGNGGIEIYNKSGLLLYENPNVRHNYYYNQESFISQIRLINNNLYFIQDNDCTFVMKYIEINNNFKEISIDSFDATEQC